jgi:hypothetical protein
LKITQLAPSLINDVTETQRVRESLEPLLEPGCLHSRGPKVMGTEDFAWMLGEMPGCYFMLGNGEGEFHGCSVHNPHYYFNDELIRHLLLEGNCRSETRQVPCGVQSLVGDAGLKSSIGMSFVERPHKPLQ